MIKITSERITIAISLLSIAISICSLRITNQAAQNIAAMDRGEPDIVLCQSRDLITYNPDDYQAMVTLPSTGPKAAVYSCGTKECCLTGYRSDYDKEIASRIRQNPQMPRYSADGKVLIIAGPDDYRIYRKKHGEP
jgi:hypothetical protein